MSCVTYEAVDQPPIWEHTSTDDVFIKQLYLAKAYSTVPQHSHEYDHTTLLAVGRLRVWSEKTPTREYSAPAIIHIQAHDKHTFLSLEDGTLAYCIHNVMRQGKVEIHEEHELKVG